MYLFLVALSLCCYTGTTLVAVGGGLIVVTSSVGRGQALDAQASGVDACRL